MTRVIEQPGDAQAMAAFHQAFRTARVGMVVPDLPAAPAGTAMDGGGMQMPLYGTPNGLSVVRACADPEVFARRYDPSINALMIGEAVLEMTLKVGSVAAGVLVASAASEHSILIPNARIAELLGARADGATAEPPSKPWWKLW